MLNENFKNATITKKIALLIPIIISAVLLLLSVLIMKQGDSDAFLPLETLFGYLGVLVISAFCSFYFSKFIVGDGKKRFFLSLIVPFIIIVLFYWIILYEMKTLLFNNFTIRDFIWCAIWALCGTKRRKKSHSEPLVNNLVNLESEFKAKYNK